MTGGSRNCSNDLPGNSFEDEVCSLVLIIAKFGYSTTGVFFFGILKSSPKIFDMYKSIFGGAFSGTFCGGGLTILG